MRKWVGIPARAYRGAVLGVALLGAALSAHAQAVTANQDTFSRMNPSAILQSASPMQYSTMSESDDFPVDARPVMMFNPSVSKGRSRRRPSWL